MKCAQSTRQHKEQEGNHIYLNSPKFLALYVLFFNFSLKKYYMMKYYPCFTDQGTEAQRH